MIDDSYMEIFIYILIIEEKDVGRIIQVFKEAASQQDKTSNFNYTSNFNFKYIFDQSVQNNHCDVARLTDRSYANNQHHYHNHNHIYIRITFILIIKLLTVSMSFFYLLEFNILHFLFFSSM